MAVFFSICIPQFNRTSFLKVSLARLREQTMNDFEICISDGGSTDSRDEEIENWLMQSGVPYRFVRQRSRMPYDRNLRQAIHLASGRYCFLLGNDDMLASVDTLSQLREALVRFNYPAVAMTNYTELGTGREFHRCRKTGILSAGVDTAVATFRNYSFVSGIILDRERAQRLSTDAWDGSEMYQMYLGSRIVAAGGSLLNVAQNVILKDIQIAGQRVDSYATRPRSSCGVREHQLPLNQLGRVVVDAVSVNAATRKLPVIVRHIFKQIILFTYPPWLLEYRRTQSFRYAIGVALGMRPRHLLKGVEVGLLTRTYVTFFYIVASIGGLLMPQRLFRLVRPWLYAFAKRQRRQ